MISSRRYRSDIGYITLLPRRADVQRLESILQPAIFRECASDFPLGWVLSGEWLTQLPIISALTDLEAQGMIAFCPGCRVIL